MNTQNNTRETNAFSTRTIVNFPFLTTESLNELIDTLGFKMGLPELRFCQNTFRNKRLNNPTINELKIIDRVFYDHSKRAAASLVASFMTNDKTVADTYADLMARRKAIEPDYTAPCSVVDMLNILPKYLGQNTFGDISLFAGKSRNADLSAYGFKKIAETGASSPDCAAGIKIKISAEASITNGNIVYAVLKSFNPYDNFTSRLDALLSSVEMHKSAKYTAVFENESVITVLSEFGRGIKLNTIHYEGKDGAISPFEPLAEGDTGIITVFDKPESVDMLLSAQLFGLRVIPLGYIAPSDSIDGIAQSGEHLVLSIPFLHSLAFSRPVGCEADGEKPDIADYESSVYINVNKDRYRMNSALCGGESYYMAGFNSVLYSYSLCVASGADSPAVASTYTLPLNTPTKKDLGKAVELVLGAYMAECQFELSDSAPKVEIGSTPALSFHTLAKTSLGIPSRFMGKDTKIYYLEPMYKENGLPDFENLKQMHTYIKSLIARGAVTSIHPTTDDINKTLSKMSDTITPVLITEQTPTSRYGGFVIESSENIQGQLIGRICSEPA